jgi:hypothetical protein
MRSGNLEAAQSRALMQVVMRSTRMDRDLGGEGGTPSHGDLAA